MAAAREQLVRIAREHLPADIAEKWIALLRPAAKLRKTRLGEMSIGQLGGEPSLPDGMAWPEWEGHGPLTFIASVECAPLAAIGLDIPLPHDGTLAFFYFDGQLDQAHALVGFDIGTLAGARVLYIPSGIRTSPRPLPIGLQPYRRMEVTAERVASYPDLDQPAVAEAFAGPDAKRTMSLLGSDALFDALSDLEPQHQIGGYAFPIQGAVEYEIAGVQLGGHPPYEPDAMARERRSWVLLAQIDSDNDATFEWGDGGTLYWLMRPEDLRRGRFEAASFTWQCL